MKEATATTTASSAATAPYNEAIAKPHHSFHMIFHEPFYNNDNNNNRQLEKEEEKKWYKKKFTFILLPITSILKAYCITLHVFLAFHVFDRAKPTHT